MDYHLRQLKHKALSEGTAHAWHAYARSLERVKGHVSEHQQLSTICFDIDWEIDDEHICYRGECPGSCIGLPMIVVFHSEGDISDELESELSDRYGFLVNSFDFEVTGCINTDRTLEFED